MKKYIKIHTPLLIAIFCIFILLKYNCYAGCSESIDGDCEDVSYMTPEESRAILDEARARGELGRKNAISSAEKHRTEVIISGLIALIGIGLHLHLKNREKAE